MKEKFIQSAGLLLTVVYGGFILWLYWAAPKDLGDVTTKAKETIENTTTKTEVLIGTYEVDPALFGDGLKSFRADNFVAARDAFLRADPERRDAKTQFYIAYSYYRQGWGRVYSDDELFKKGLDETARVTAIDKNFKSDDADLKMKTPAELKNEFEEGLRVTASDFNPLKLTRERK
ncbi:MAG: hypothetical protein JSS81_12530 [Acidobacteria bacterium]|nr:hypothetical protein [Acidobacteriota bacterium]